MIPIIEERPSTTAAFLPDCSDLDEDCADIENKEHCWLHAPELGMCPFLRASKEKTE